MAIGVNTTTYGFSYLIDRLYEQYRCGYITNEQLIETLQKFKDTYASSYDNQYTSPYTVGSQNLLQQLQYQDERNRQLLQQNQELQQKIKTLRKEGYMARSDFFTKDGECKEHYERDCETCTLEWQEQEQEQNSRKMTLVTSTLVEGGHSPGAEDLQLHAHQMIKHQVRFVKKSLGLTDEKIKKTKVKDLPQLIKKAEDEITVGGMEELLEEDTRDAKGFIKGIIRFFFR